MISDLENFFNLDQICQKRERECVCSKIMYTVTPKFTQNSNDDMLPWYL